MSSADADRSPVPWGGRWVPFLAGAAVVLVASMLPVPVALAGAGAGSGGGAPVGPLASLGPTAVFHLIGYAGLAALATRAIGRSRETDGAAAATGARGGVLAVGAAVAVGFCAELLQSRVAWRSFAWSDAGVNAAGAVLGVAAVAALLSLRRAARGADDER